MRELGSLLVVSVLALISCGAPRTPMFKVGHLSEDWRRVDSKGDLAFHSRHGGTIYANVDCERDADAPLNVLVNHLLFDIDVKEERREEITLAGRKALRAHVAGEVDGVPVELEAVVMTKDGCTYDLLLVAGPKEFAELEDDFEEFVAGFETREHRRQEREQEGWACSVVPC